MKRYYIIVLLFLLQCSVVAQVQSIENKISRSTRLLGSSTYTYANKYYAGATWFQQSTGREYLIYNAIENLFFVDITDPKNPQLKDSVQTLAMIPINTIFVYGKYCYASDAFNYTTICDLSYLPDSVVYINTVITPTFKNISLIGDKLFFATGKDISVSDLSNSLNPQVVDSLSEDFSRLDTVQALMIQNDTIYASCGYQGLFRFGYDLQQKTFLMIDSIPNNPGIPSLCRHYVSHRFLIRTPPAYSVNEDIYLRNTTAAYSYNNSTTFFPVKAAKYFSRFDSERIISFSGSTLFLYDLQDVWRPRELGSYSMYGLSSVGFKTCFTNKLGTAIIAVHATEGVLILDPREALKTKLPADSITYTLNISPNPTASNVIVTLKRDLPSDLNIMTSNGVTIYSKHFTGTINENINLKSFTEGVYILKIDGAEGLLTQKIVVQH